MCSSDRLSQRVQRELQPGQGRFSDLSALVRGVPSDNGRRIIGYDDRRDGIGDRFADVLNSRTGRIQVRARVPVNGYIGQVLWEDNDSVVVNALVNGRAQLCRVNASSTWKRVARALRFGGRRQPLPPGRVATDCR